MTTGIEQVIDVAKTQTAVARKLGVSPQAVQGWVKQGWVPLARCNELEALYGVPARFLMSKKNRDALPKTPTA